jgi:hypothetical protein
METYELAILGSDTLLQFEGDDDLAAIAVALSAQSPLGHILSRSGRFVGWFDPPRIYARRAGALPP